MPGAGTVKGVQVAGTAFGQAGRWVECYCCGLSFEAPNMVSFDRHPEEGLCVGCTGLLWSRSRHIVRRMYPPLGQLPARARACIAPVRWALVEGIPRLLDVQPPGTARRIGRTVAGLFRG